MPSRCQMEKKSGTYLKNNDTHPLRPTDFTTNTQMCASFIQVYSGDNAEEINNISRHTVTPIELQVRKTDDNMVVL